MNLKNLLFAVGCCTALVSCGTPPTVTRETAPSVTRPVYTADGYNLPMSRLFTVLDNGPLLPAGGFLADSVVRSVAESLMVDTLTSFEARTFSIEKYPHEYRDYRYRVGTLLASFYYQNSVVAKVQVDSQKVLDFYEQHKSRFSVPEQCEVYHIQVSPTYLKKGPDSLKYGTFSDARLDTIASVFADSLYGLLQSGASFKKVAEQFSHDERTRFMGGYVGWTRRGKYPEPFDSIAFQLKPGEYCRPYRDADGYHIILVTDHVADGPLPISRTDVYTEIKEIATRTAISDRATAVADSLSKGLTVVYNPAVVDSNILETADTLWYAIVNGRDTIEVLPVKDPISVASSRKKPRVLTDSERSSALALQINRSLMIDAAKTERYDTLPKFLEQKAQDRINVARGILTRQWYGPEFQTTDSQVAEYYRTHLEDFVPAKPITVQQIVAKDSVTAEFLRAQASSGIDFLDLAQQYYPGDSAVRRQLADLGKIGPNDVDSSFFHAAMITAVGDISRPVKTRFGYHIIKVLARQDVRSLDEANGDIQERLKRIYRSTEFEKTKTRLFRLYHARYSNNFGRVFLEPIAYRRKK